MPRLPLGHGKESHFVERGHTLKGVVHVGANDGEEITWYTHVGRTPVLAFEPQPDVYREACENYRPEIEAGLVRIEQMALGERNESITIQVPLNAEGIWNTKAASALGVPLAQPPEWNQTSTVRDVTVTCMRFDTWVDLNEWNLEPYNVLVIDVQGMELDVLKGFGLYLHNFPYLMVECSAEPFWVGEASGAQVSDWLAAQGYRRDSPIVSHNDVMFIKEGL